MNSKPTSAEPLERPSSLADALSKARSIFVQAPASNPRALQQAYNSFQFCWNVLELRKLAKEMDARILAVILWLQYVRRDIYDRILSCPELFFYLHALLKKAPNDLCSQSEIDEIYELDLPAEGAAALTSLFRLPDLTLVFRALNRPPEDVDKLMCYISLERVFVRRSVNSQDPLAALMSGDPALVKWAIKTSSLTNWPELLNLQMVRALGASDPREISKAVQAVFALGRLRDTRAVDLVSSVFQFPQQRSPEILLRSLYALKHQATDPDHSENGKARRSKALLMLVTLMKDTRLENSLRQRAINLLRDCALTEDHVRDLLALYVPEGPEQEPGELRSAIRNVLHYHCEKSLSLMQPSRFSPDDVLDLCEAATHKSTKWPWRIAHYLISAVGQSDAIGDRAFKLIKSVANPAARARWLIWVVLRTKRLRSECLQEAGQAQSEPIPWQGRAWRLLRDQLLRDEQQTQLVDTLRRTKRTEAAPMLGALYNVVHGSRFREQIYDALDDMRNAGVRGTQSIIDAIDQTKKGL